MNFPDNDLKGLGKMVLIWFLYTKHFQSSETLELLLRKWLFTYRLFVEQKFKNTARKLMEQVKNKALQNLGSFAIFI